MLKQIPSKISTSCSNQSKTVLHGLLNKPLSTASKKAQTHSFV